uniref:Alpha-ketoglutarate-dependent dioxygenase AlkB-like domain-containing protein n=1 Tax=Parascaris univalens TaxID=6257 RepID=A0A914ZT24_PARUN
MRVGVVHRALELVFFHNESIWPAKMKELISHSCSVIPDFITEKEERSLLNEIEPHMKRLRYEKSHWDDAIHLFREREQRRWSEENESIIQRVRDKSFKKGDAHLSYVHILDLHKDGVIKPHIDSIRYCGDVISGMCLLSDAVLRLRHKDRKDELIVDFFVPRRCLYRMGEYGRYEFTHEVLGKDESFFNGRPVPRDRRISVICRDLPKAFVEAQERAKEIAAHSVGAKINGEATQNEKLK